jgi:hypothetical protein
MDYEDGHLKTLFHGIGGSRTVKQWVPIHADIKFKVKDGTSKSTYTSGWHVLETKAQAVAYLHKFKNLDKKVIVKCKASGDIWKKGHSPFDGLWLAEILEIRDIVVLSDAIIGSLLFPVKSAIRENAKTLVKAFGNATWDLSRDTKDTTLIMKLRSTHTDLEKFINNLIKEVI